MSPNEFFWMMIACRTSLYNKIVNTQDIAAAEEESAKSKVGAAAAQKQLEKLKKETAKTKADLDKAESDLEAFNSQRKVRCPALFFSNASAGPGQCCNRSARSTCMCSGTFSALAAGATMEDL